MSPAHECRRCGEVFEGSPWQDSPPIEDFEKNVPRGYAPGPTWYWVIREDGQPVIAKIYRQKSNSSEWSMTISGGAYFPVRPGTLGVRSWWPVAIVPPKGPAK